MAAGGGGHSPLCRYNAAYCAERGRYIDGCPFFHDIPGFHYSSARYCSALCRCLQFRLRAMPRARSPVRGFWTTMRFRCSGATLSPRCASDTSTSGRCSASGMIAGTPDIITLGNGAGGSQQQHERTIARGQGHMCTFCALSNAYTRVGCIRARERSCASMARYLDAQERHCGLSAYARRERARGAIGW